MFYCFDEKVEVDIPEKEFITGDPIFSPSLFLFEFSINFILFLLCLMMPLFFLLFFIKIDIMFLK